MRSALLLSVGNGIDPSTRRTWARLPHASSRLVANVTFTGLTSVPRQHAVGGSSSSIPGCQSPCATAELEDIALSSACSQPATAPRRGLHRTANPEPDRSGFTRPWPALALSAIPAFESQHRLLGMSIT